MIGSARREDPEGDLADGDGTPPRDPFPHADLIAAQLEGDGERLFVRIETAGDIPADPARNGVFYNVLLWTDLEYDNGPDYQLIVEGERTGARWYVAVADFETGMTTTLHFEPAINGNQLVIAFPLENLLSLKASFLWTAGAALGFSYEDFVTGTTSTFPSESEVARFPE